MPMGTAPLRLTFCTDGPAATIVVSWRMGSTVDMLHSRGSTALITSSMRFEPSRAPSISAWMLVSHSPVMLDGACTRVSASGSAGTVDVAVGGADVTDGAVLVGGGVVVTGGVATSTGSSAWQPYRDAREVARSPPAWCQPTIASMLLSTNASVKSTTGSSADTDAAMPTLRSWSAAVLATASEVGSLAATPITSDSCSPALLMLPRVSGAGVGTAEVLDPADGVGGGGGVFGSTT